MKTYSIILTRYQDLAKATAALQMILGFQPHEIEALLGKRPIFLWDQLENLEDGGYPDIVGHVRNLLNNGCSVGIFINPA